MTDWAIPHQAKLKYTQLFNLHDRSRSGFLSGVQCRDILMQSGLPRNILAEIWNLSDIDGDGQLAREEFILAMHLTNQVRAGQALPNQLPPDLVPPSYRRQRSISTTSVQSSTSVSSSIGSGTAAPSAIHDDSTLSTEAVGSSVGQVSILNSNSFEDKRRENFEKGRAELERRRLKIIEQQTSILSEQLVRCKKQVAEAKSKIDSMRSERDTKAGLLTSLEAQLKTVRDRKTFLDHEEVQIIAMAKDLNLVKSAHLADLDHQATQARQESIDKMKNDLTQLINQKDESIKRAAEAQARLEELKKDFKAVSDKANNEFKNYKEQIAKAQTLKIQWIEESRSKPINLDSAWESATASYEPSFYQQQQQSSPSLRSSEPTKVSTSSSDPWTTGSIQTAEDPFAESNNNNSMPAPDFNPSSADIGQKSTLFEGNTCNNFNIGPTIIPETATKKKIYKALFAFEARNVDELTINPGDIIIGSEDVCEPGWLSGKIDGRSGLFPEAYVELASNDDPFATRDDRLNNGADGLASISVENNSSHQLDDTNLARDIDQTQVKSPTSAITKYKVIYAFEARNEDELTINIGDIVTGIGGQHEPGWLMGQLNDHKGLFPEAYVEKFDEQASTIEQTGTLRRGSSTGSLRSKKSRAKKAEVATAVANYRALGQEQLSLEKGQLVLIRRKTDSGWWEGELQIKDNQRENNFNAKQFEQQPIDELDRLIEELVESEWDYVNDLRLCQSAYIFPLSNTFDVSNIFINWNQLIQMHDLSLTKLSMTSQAAAGPNLDYRFVFVTFLNLFNSIIDLYVDYCSRQSESTRQLEAKIASDIRFKQLVSESQRKLRKLIETQLDDSVETCHDDLMTVDRQKSAEIARALRNSNLPLTSFLIKPIQRITKYGLLFEKMLKVISENVKHRHLQPQIDRLLQSAQNLCSKVNEACRIKEDDQDNTRRLRWCQSHIKQQGTMTSLFDSPSSRASFSNSSISSLDLKSYPTISGYQTNDELSSTSFNEFIIFNSNTNCLGRRKLLKTGSLLKYRSGRELMLFLFNDFLLLTQIKGGSSLRVDDLFKSDRSQQAYYKFYRAPIMLEDIQLDDLDLEEQHFQSLSCPSINSSSQVSSINKEQEALMISFFDRQSGLTYNLLAMSVKEKNHWLNLLRESSMAAKNSRKLLLTCSKLSRLNTNDCLGRVFITVLELTRVISSPASPHKASLIDSNSSWGSRAPGIDNRDHVQNLCIRIQLRLYKKSHNNLGEEKREVLPLSDEFRTNPIIVNDLKRQPTIADMNESMSNLDIQRDRYGFDNNSTQFLIPNHRPSFDGGQEYLDIELIDDSRFRETRLISFKRISLDHLLGRNLIETHESTRKLSSLSSRSIQAIQVNRPVDMTLKLRSKISDKTRSDSSPSSSINDRSINSQMDQQRFNIKLRFHLQTFCDTTSLI